MGREWMLLGVSVTVTLALAVALLRWWAPGLLGITPDLQLVRVAEKIVPFYENVFRIEDREAVEFILKDPYTVVRARPLAPSGFLGPTDILGFRNESVPNAPDVIAIGDSQTFGLNAPLSANWPSRLQLHLGAGKARIYSMAIGGWGAVQYLDMLDKAIAFGPKVMIVAFYSGNDAMESFQLAYSAEHWASLRVDPTLARSDAPKRLAGGKNQMWIATLPLGQKIAFTPQLRLYSMQDHPVADAGWEIMAEAARRMSTLAAAHDVSLVFIVIPTKELVYLPKLELLGVTLDPTYSELVTREKRRLERLSARLDAIETAHYVELLGSLQQMVLRGHATHPHSIDGHPTKRGYDVIARRLAPTVSRLLDSASMEANESK